MSAVKRSADMTVRSLEMYTVSGRADPSTQSLDYFPWSSARSTLVSRTLPTVQAEMKDIATWHQESLGQEEAKQAISNVLAPPSDCLN